ncbi:MAG: protein translocase subunit SecF [Chromatiales bacterium]|nr:protein translocase subunit SecF [Chromatiales bacterium]
MEFFRKQTNIDFMMHRRRTAVVSGILLLVAIAALAIRGLNWGIDFTGGVLLEVGYPQAADLVQIRAQLAEGGYGDAVVQNFGTARDVLIRIMPREGVDSGALGQQLLDVLRAAEPGVALRRIEFVGPQVGSELAEQGALAMLFTLLMIMAYIIFRFQWKFSVGAVAALAHDVILVVGIFALFGWTFDLAILAAILAVIGYSLNDTIVVFDRVRENFRKIRRGTPEEIVNRSVNDMLSRTVMTSFATLLVLLALLFLGGETLWGFSMALTLGVIVGTYSSIYVASAVTLALGINPLDLQPPKQDEEDEELKATP